MILGAAIAGPASAAQVFVAIDPCRIFDTRAGDAPAVPNDPTLATTRTVTIQGNANCPDVPATGVTAVVGNVIAVQATAAGFLTIFPEDVGFQGASHINFPAFTDVSHFATDNGGILPLDGTPLDGDLGLAWDTTPTTPAGTHTVHVVIDVTGYFIELAIGTGGGFSKTDIYVNSQGGAAPGAGAFTRTASCNDGNDIALSGHCHSTGTDTVYMMSQNLTNFDTTATAASFQCDFESQGPNGNGQARIVCVDVP